MYSKGGGDGTSSADGSSADVFYYVTLYNENYPMPKRPEGVTDDQVVRASIVSTRPRIWARLRAPRDRRSAS